MIEKPKVQGRSRYPDALRSTALRFARCRQLPPQSCDQVRALFERGILSNGAMWHRSHSITAQEAFSRANSEHEHLDLWRLSVTWSAPLAARTAGEILARAWTNSTPLVGRPWRTRGDLDFEESLHTSADTATEGKDLCAVKKDGGKLLKAFYQAERLVIELL